MRRYLLFQLTLIIEYCAREDKLAAKHLVEEAMTEALVSKCNNCNKSFVKEDGCNYLRCPCGNSQCYVCGSNVVDYSHFGNPCDLYADMQKVLKEQVAAAHERTVKQVLRNGGAELKEEDVRVEKLETQSLESEVGVGMPYLREPENMFIDALAFHRLVGVVPDGRGRHNTGGVHRCQPCGKSFGSETSLSQHRNAKHHNGEITTCGICKKSFGSAKALSDHTRDKRRDPDHRSKRKRGPGSSGPMHKRTRVR